jgi:hypothetical protein
VGGAASNAGAAPTRRGTWRLASRVQSTRTTHLSEPLSSERCLLCLVVLGTKRSTQVRSVNRSNLLL